MTASSQTGEVVVVVLETNHLVAELLKAIVIRALPQAKVEIANRLAQFPAIVLRTPVDLLIAGTNLADGDVLDFLFSSLRPGGRICKAFLVVGRVHERILHGLRLLPLAGVFDSTAEGVETLESALRSVVTGRSYWSHTILSQMCRHLARPENPYGELSDSERRILAQIGDGSDDKEAATRLEMKASSIHSVRRALHRKLQLRHRGELVRFAVRHGYVDFRADMVIRPGLALSEATHRPNSRQL